MSTARTTMTVRQAAFIGVGAMVGAGIFALLGTAGEVAGAAVWLSFLIAGAIAGLQGYSFGKLGSRYPSAGGLLEYLARGFGRGHLTGASCWLTYGANIIVTALVAVSFGSYAASMLIGEDAGQIWVKVFAAVVLIGMLGLNMIGSNAVAKVQTVIVWIVVGILIAFAVVTIVNMDLSLLDVSAYPSFRSIISSVALTFFAFLGFGVITFTAKDLANPSKELPKAMYLALGIATVTYVAVALGVFGTLTVDEVIASGGTAIAVAAEPTLGRFGFWLMSATGLFATAGATNAGIYPAAGLAAELASTRQFPPVFGRSIGRAGVGAVVMVALTLLLAIGFDLGAIASLGSAVALLIFTLVTVAHLRIRRETGASIAVLLVALTSTVVTLAVFLTTTMVDDPATIVALAAILILSVGLELWWTSVRDRKGSRFGGDPAVAESPATAEPIPDTGTPA